MSTLISIEDRIIMLENDILTMNLALMFIKENNRDVKFPDENEMAAIRKKSLDLIKKSYPALEINPLKQG